MKVDVHIEEITLTNDDNIQVDSVCARCSRCDHETESFGTSEASRRRCLELMREECPNEESNFYVDVDEDCN